MRKTQKGIYLRLIERRVRSEHPVEITVNPVNGRGGRIIVRKTGFEILPKN